MKFLLDEMYPPALAASLRAQGLEVSTALDCGLAGRPDADVMATASADGYVLVTENVADFARLASEHITAGNHHPGVVIALSWRFSRRPHGIPKIAAALSRLADQQLDDRLIYLGTQP